ncbi:MAG: PTS sugar transporter subunit IIB [Clostridium sp.]|nr:PTS sugar transporter subunit IIB [Clostridium sp.]
MSVKFSRIDDRLIHGQVVTTWVNVWKVEQIIIVNEKAFNDKMQSAVLKMSAPSNIVLHIFSPDKFLSIVKKNPVKKSTMLIFANVEDVLYLVERGFLISHLNVGGMRPNENRKTITKAVALTESEKECFRKLIDKGVDVEIQMVPKDNVVKMREVLGC